MNNSNLYFSTFTNLNWIRVLEKDEHKDIIIDSLRFLVVNKRVSVFGFVIMPNHVHLLWEMKNGNKLSNVQRDFLKYTAQMIKFKMIESGEGVDPALIVDACDRETQIWERKGHSFQLFKYNTIVQKLSYIHINPINKKWKLCGSLEMYRYSSIRFYLNGDQEFDFLTDFYELDCVAELMEESDATVKVAC
jgi:putative transposase